MKKYRITIEFESDIDAVMADIIAMDCFAQLETIEDEEDDEVAGTYSNATYKVEEIV